ncbi:hypothetical protein ZWY2020_043670 [Hordeum vulgare]|nr:hypothetical protein ZWY2020_047387 [Hordeum vulgare]KAI5018782.1 hypothetical protein ZWY2020_043670 [Hordeum vulgare]
MGMRGNISSRLCALLLFLLCVAAHFQGASCRGGGGHGVGGHGGRGGDGGRWRGGGAGMPWSYRHSAAAEPCARGGVDWRVSGCAILAAALVRWL